MTITTAGSAPQRSGDHRPRRREALLLVPAAVPAVATAYLADAAREHDGASRIDPAIAADVLKLRDPGPTALAHVLTFIGSEVVVGAIALVVLGLLLWRRRWAQAAPFAFAMGLSVFLTVTLKLLVARPRPAPPYVLGPIDRSYSFPSGHTLNSAVLIALLVWLLWRRATPLGRTLLIECGVLLAAGIGASRIYLGYHWTTDVVASWLVALAVLLVVRLVSTMVRDARRPASSYSSA